MATKDPNDKYAFLFSGPAGDLQLKDLENVADVLVNYYNYPVGHITIVLGSTTTVTDFFGVPLVVVGSLAALEAQLATFTTAAALANKTVLLYTTGWGARESGVSKLAIDGAATPALVDPPWLTARLNAFGPAQVNVVMQQDNCGGFDSALTGCTLADWTFTFACTATEYAYGDSPVVMGSYFTHAWTRGLKLEQLNVASPDNGKYADQLTAGAEGANLLVSLEEAADFGKQIHDLDPAYAMLGVSAPGYVNAGGCPPQHLGEPDLLIRDGSPSWYESPDITLTHPNHPWVDADPTKKDWYIADSPLPPPPPGVFHNTVNVRIRNVGSHPVRLYSAVIALFQSGGGGTSDDYSICDIVPAGGVLRPVKPTDIDTPDDIFDTCAKNIKFENTSTHRCVKAEVKRFCVDLDLSWNPSANDFEGQRNIDLMTVIPPQPSPSPMVNPELIGLKKHIYEVKNPYDQPCTFYIAFPENYFQYEKMIRFDWFELSGFAAEQAPLEIMMEPLPHIAFVLKPGQSKKVVFSAMLNAKYPLEEDVVLPFEILVEKPDWDVAVANVRAPGMTIGDNLAGFAGLTVVIRKGSGALKGVVLDRDQKPAAGAKIFLRTINDLQGAVVTAGKDGAFDFETINEDVYKMRAEGNGWRSGEIIIPLGDGRVEDLKVDLLEPPGDEDLVRVVIDRIRILDDSDPCIKGKGELTFTSVVVPDHDATRKQKTRLPDYGVYHVSDKAGENDIDLGVTVFHGEVKNNHLSFSISGKEIDLFDPDDELARYHREFAGDPTGWYGKYMPGDEYLDAENVGDWAIWYRILRG